MKPSEKINEMALKSFQSKYDFIPVPHQIRFSDWLNAVTQYLDEQEDRMDAYEQEIEARFKKLEEVMKKSEGPFTSIPKGEE